MDRAFTVAIFFISVLVGNLSGCASDPPCLDKTSFTGTIAQYSVKPDHKAVYFNADPKSHFSTTYVSGRPSTENARVDAETACRNNAVTGNYDPAKCYPVAIDNKQTVFNPTTLYCGATPQTSLADQAAYIDALSNLANSLKK